DFESVIFSPDKMFHAVVRNDGVVGLYNSKTDKLVWAVSPDGGLINGYINADKIKGLQYNSALNSDASDQIATPLAVKNTNSRITDVHNIVLNINDKFNTNNIESRVYSHDKRFYLIVRDDGTVGMYNAVTNSLMWGFDANGLLGVGKIGTANIFDLEQFFNDRMPVGVPLPWPTITPPPNFLICNGWLFDKSKYPRLAAAYPSGVLPEMRASTIRGLDAGRGIDVDRTILSEQGDAMRNLTGTFGFESNIGGKSGAPNVSGVFYAVPDPSRTHLAAGTGGDNTTVVLDASRQVPVAHEFRVRSTAFLYIVRAA
ncbi:tail fiber protein, partial [Gilliamella sp. B2969]